MLDIYDHGYNINYQTITTNVANKKKQKVVSIIQRYQ
jgi:hypothetical protein